MADNLFDDFDLDSFDFGDFDSLDTGVGTNTQPEETPEVEHIVTTLKKRAMVVFFVVDVSGSMRGARIGAVNDAIRNVIPELKKREKNNTAAEIHIAVLEFSTNTNWRTAAPQPVATYQYQDIVDVGGATNYGKAFSALNEKMSSKQFLKSTAGAYMPLVIFMTDGKPSDMGLYGQELERLRHNNWFKNSTRAGIAIEEGALSEECKRVLGEFTGNEDNVYEAKNTVVLAKQIELVTLTGVDFVTQQGSVQNSDTSVTSAVGNNGFVSSTAPPNNSNTSTNQARQSSNTSQQSASASPTLPVGDIDWENDFDF